MWEVGAVRWVKSEKLWKAETDLVARDRSERISVVTTWEPEGRFVGRHHTVILDADGLSVLVASSGLCEIDGAVCAHQQLVESLSKSGAVAALEAA